MGPRHLLGLFLGALASGCGATALPPPATVAKVDLQRYVGRWYEIARLPFRIQDGCYATTATYTVRPDGDLRVENRCLDRSFTGKERVAVGKAWVVDKTTNAKLKVQFFWPFRGDYWVLGLGPDYDWALVGDPRHRYLWVLSRTPQLPPSTYEAIVALARQQGYDVAKLIPTPQPPG
jgi:apolipoprotein D and lipocalin family protein